MRALHDVNPSPLSFRVSQARRVIRWRVGSRSGTCPITNPKPSAIAAQMRDIAVRFNTNIIV